jgi:uncharacterized protein
MKLPTSPEAEIVVATADHVRSRLIADSSGHDWWHVQRVWQVAKQIAVEEAADLTVVELAALLHDIADWKFHDGDESAGPRAARDWLSQYELAPQVVEHVCTIIATLSFKGANVPTPMDSLEGCIVQDADRLDAVGAIGIARAFAYGGHKGRAMYDPQTPPEPHQSFEAYKRNSGPTINHFYEKLLLLKERMNTRTARRIAEERHAFMESFIQQFFREWNVDLLERE